MFADVVYIIFCMRVSVTVVVPKTVTLDPGTRGSMILAVCLLPLAAHICLKHEDNAAR
jgi:hypothetical protein